MACIEIIVGYFKHIIPWAYKQTMINYYQNKTQFVNFQLHYTSILISIDARDIGNRKLE